MMKITIGINGTRFPSDRSKGLLRVVRIEAGQARPEVLMTFSPDKMAQAIRYAEKYAARFGHVALRDPLYVGPRF